MAFPIERYSEKLQDRGFTGTQLIAAVDCWFTSEGKTIPRFCKVKGTEEELITIRNFRILKEEQKLYAGIHAKKHWCEAEHNGVMVDTVTESDVESQIEEDSQAELQEDSEAEEKAISVEISPSIYFSQPVLAESSFDMNVKITNVSDEAIVIDEARLSMMGLVIDDYNQDMTGTLLAGESKTYKYSCTLPFNNRKSVEVYADFSFTYHDVKTETYNYISVKSNVFDVDVDLGVTEEVEVELDKIAQDRLEFDVALSDYVEVQPNSVYKITFNSDIRHYSVSYPTENENYKTIETGTDTVSSTTSVEYTVKTGNAIEDVIFNVTQSDGKMKLTCDTPTIIRVYYTGWSDEHKWDNSSCRYLKVTSRSGNTIYKYIYTTNIEEATIFNGTYNFEAVGFGYLGGMGLMLLDKEDYFTSINFKCLKQGLYEPETGEDEGLISTIENYDEYNTVPNAGHSYATLPRIACGEEWEVTATSAKGSDNTETAGLESLYMSGQALISEGKIVGSFPDGVSYDTETNTLTLDNYTGEVADTLFSDIDSDDEYYNAPRYGIYAKGGVLTINLVGESNITNSGDFGSGIYGDGTDITITGD